MASPSQRIYTVRLHPASASTSARNGKKVFVAGHVLKALKLAQGDLVMVKPALTAGEVQKIGLEENGQTDKVKGKEKERTGSGFFVGTVFPSFTLDADTIELSSAAILSASLSPGDLASFVPLPPVLPSDYQGSGQGLKLPKAGEIVLKEVGQEGREVTDGRRPRKVGERWRTAIEDVLLDHRYVASGQYISVAAPSEAVPSPAAIASPTPASRANRARSASPFVPTASPSRVGKSPAPAQPVSTSKARPARTFQIVEMESTSAPVQRPKSDRAPAPAQLFIVSPDSSVRVIRPPSPEQPNGVIGGPSQTPPSMQDVYDTVGGLDEQVAKIRELVELPLTRPELYSHFDLTPPRGILLHGPPGTGKTLLSSLLARSLNCHLVVLSPTSVSSPYHGETEQALSRLFDDAKRQSPCVIVCDEVDALCPKREEGGEVERRVVGTMVQCLEALHEPVKEDKPAPGSEDASDSEFSSDEDELERPNAPPRVVVIGTTNRLNAIDPALRRPGRFDHEIEIPTPPAQARLAILRVLLRRTPHALSEAYLADAASRTHGFVGADLRSLVHTAGLNAIKRSLAKVSAPASVDGAHAPAPAAPSDVAIEEMRLTEADVEAALLVTRPSAMREVFVETPKVLWSDIGGQEAVKRRLRESVEWPVKHPDTFKRLGIRPPRGVLLYGPPGCSKTLTARALATEGGLNFIAVKGPEVFSKYVGESEKAVREIFGKARAAAPSIIFLDEIDAIAMSRGGDDGGSGTGDRVLTSLLTEMDGVEELNGVLVLAATNRPDVLDSALLRPGRLDRILYVGPPDLPSRIEIFKINFSKMAVASDVDVEELANLTDGCTGAEIVSVCQDAAMTAMHEDLSAPHVRRVHFVQAAAAVRRRTTPEVVAAFEAWRDQSGVRSA